VSVSITERELREHAEQLLDHYGTPQAAIEALRTGMVMLKKIVH